MRESTNANVLIYNIFSFFNEKQGFNVPCWKASYASRNVRRLADGESVLVLLE